jgi:multidrug efflux pump subunit AcrA (membrane-fusion protein)
MPTFTNSAKACIYNSLIIVCITLYSCNHSTIIKAERKNIYETVYASGKIIAANEHTIFALTNGTVVKKFVREEDIVKKDQQLFEIQNTSTTSGLNIASDKVKLVQQFASPAMRQDKYFITSDCNGIVYKTMKEQGEAVHLNEPVILIGDASKRIIKLFVDQQDINKIKIGQRGLVKTDITGDTIYKVSIVKIYSLLDEAAQSFRVDAVFTTNFPNKFIHDALEANIVINEKQNALVIPRYALAGKDSLWIRQNGRSEKIKVETGIASSGYIEILKGINETTQVIISKTK